MKKNILSIITIIILLVVAVGLKSVADTMKEMNAEPIPTPSVGVVPSPTATPITEVIDTEGRVMGPQEAVFKVGDVQEIAGVIIRLDAISADSRCPADVTCIQAGKVDALITFALDSSNSTTTATTTISSDAVSRDVKGYDMTISKVSPIKNSKETIAPDQYEITFIITPTVTEPISPI